MRGSGVVAFQGVDGAYSQKAAREFFGAQAKTLPCAEFADVFRAVKSGKARYGVLPIENSLTGSIHQNYDLILEHPVELVGEVKLRVSHHLLVPVGATRGDLREVFSHPQALSQCQKFLKTLPKARPVPFFDTAGSARFVAESGRLDVAAIASADAGKRYGLRSLKQAIEDNPHNYTRFWVIAPAKRGPKRASSIKIAKAKLKTSVVFALKNLPGALYKSLSVFAVRDIDLLKIESRPIPGTPWQYVFYLDFATPQDAKVGARAVEHLEELTAFTRVLGTYASG